MATKDELLEELSGFEIWSIDWAQCVVIENGKICGAGLKVLESRPTRAQLRALLDEALDAEFGEHLINLGQALAPGIVK